MGEVTDLVMPLLILMVVLEEVAMVVKVDKEEVEKGVKVDLNVERLILH